MNFSISLSLTRLIKVKFNSFIRYLQKGFFAFSILDARFEPTFTKKLLNVSAMEVLFTIIFISRNSEFGDLLTLDFSVKTDFIPSLFYRFFYFRHYNV